LPRARWKYTVLKLKNKNISKICKSTFEVPSFSTNSDD